MVRPIDRFGLTLCLAVMAHGIIVLGVTFAPEDKPKTRFHTMQVVLIQQQSEEPEEAEILAQANLEGGGDSSIQEEIPTTPSPALFPGEAPQLQVPPEQTPERTSTESRQAPELLAVESLHTSELEAFETEPGDEPDENTAVANEQQAETAETPAEAQTDKLIPPIPSAAALLANSLEMAAVSARLDKKLKTKAERPRKKFISANTKEYKYASYMEAWRRKVERVGNLNYPEAARKKRLSGSLVLDVELADDGSVNKVTVRRSSGHQILDDAATRIVELAAPYAPFPKDIRSETDILHITRTWRFSSGRSSLE